MMSFLILALILVALILVLIIGIENPRLVWAAKTLIRG